jgi:quinol monooxygenase YgiN
MNHLTSSISFSKQAPKLGLIVMLEAKNGQQEQLSTVLNAALNSAVREPGTVTWYAHRITDTKFGIFDTFNDHGSREDHLNGEIAKVLEKISEDILAEPPNIKRITLLASKV